MKTILIILLFTNTLAFSKTLRGTIKDVFCGEMDPFIWGDICLVNFLTENKKYGIVYDLDEFITDLSFRYEVYAEEIKNVSATINTDDFELIRDRSALREIQSYGKEYFYVRSDDFNIELDL